MRDSFRRLIRGISRSFCNEMHVVFSDLGAIITLFAPAIVYPILFSFAFSNEIVKDVEMAVVDQSHTGLSRQLVRMLDATDEVKVTGKFTDLEEARHAYYDNQVKGIVIIPKGFEKEVLSGQQTHVSLFADAAYLMNYKQMVSGCLYASQTLGAGVKIRKLMAKGLPQSAAMNLVRPLRLNSFQLYNPTGGYGVYIVALLVVAVLQQILLMVISLVNGTSNEYKRYQAVRMDGLHGASEWIILLGRAAFYLLSCLILTVFCVGLLPKWFSFPMLASLSDLTLFFLPFILASTFLSMAVSEFFKTRELGILIFSFMALPFLFLSAIPWPPEAMPGFLKYISLLVPSTEAFKGYMKLALADASFGQVLGHWNHLWGLSLVFFAGAVFSMKRRRSAVR